MPPFYKYSYFLLPGLRTRLQGCKINIQQILQVIGEYLTIRPWKVQGLQSHLTQKEPMLCKNESTFQFDFFSPKRTTYDVFCVQISWYWVN